MPRRQTQEEPSRTRPPTTRRWVSLGEVKALDPRVERPRARREGMAGSSASRKGRGVRALTAAGVAGGQRDGDAVATASLARRERRSPRGR